MLDDSIKNPVTYRQLHEYVSGMNLLDEFFVLSRIKPDEIVKCNCNWNEGHEPHCNIVLANKIIREQKL